MYPALKMGSDRVIVLNVGGHMFATTTATLKKEPTSLLAETFTSGAGMAQAVIDDEGRFFVDRDSKHFQTILNFLRDGGRVEVPPAAHERQELLTEARFYRLEGLVRQIEDVNQTFPSAPRLAIGIPHASETYRSIIERARTEAGPENIERAEGALFAMLFAALLAPPSSPFNAAAFVDKYERSNGKDREATPFDTLGRRSLSLYYSSSHPERNGPLDRASEMGAHCTGREFAAFVKRYFSVLQYDFMQQGYVLQADQRWERIILEIPLGMATSDGASGVLFEHLVQSLGECCAASEDRYGWGGRALSTRKPAAKH